jgi:esterase
VVLDLVCEAVGKRPPLVVLHGLFGSSSNWRGVARELDDTHSVYSVDLRNHGASPWADSMDHSEMADDVLQLVERLGLERPTVMGHSMGGKTAMALALRHPGSVGRLIVVDIAPVVYADTLTPFAEAMLSVDVVATATRAEVQARLREAVPDPTMAPFLMQNVVTRNEHFDGRLNLLGNSASVAQLCAFPSSLLGARFAGPLKVIAGANSEYVTQHDGASFRPMFSDIEVEVIERAGHWVHADEPAAFLSSVRRALHHGLQPAASIQAH